MSSAPPRALCHSAGAGYTLCLFVIPSDSAGAWGQTCNPEHSLHKQAPREHRKPTSSGSGSVSRFRVFPPLLLLLFFSPSLSILLCSAAAAAAAAVKWPMVQPFCCPPARFQITSHCFCLPTTQCHIGRTDASHPADKMLYLASLWTKFRAPGNLWFRHWHGPNV